MTAAWHDQWTAATRALEVASLDLTTAVHELPAEQLGSLRRYRERVDEAQREVDRLGREKLDSPPTAPSPAEEIWPVVNP